MWPRIFDRTHERALFAAAIVVAVTCALGFVEVTSRREPPRSTRMLMASVEHGLLAYQTDHDDACPKQLDDLYTQHYLAKPPRDARGERYAFQCPGIHNKDGADLVSSGKDRRPGTADDLRSWDF